MLQTLSEQDTCLEYCRETLCVLSCISKQPRNIALLLEVNPKLPDLLIHFFKSKDVETLRFTASFLSNLLSIRSSHPVVRENLSLLFNAYSSNDLISPGFGRNARTLLHLETKRQITRCLISLTSNNSDIINKNPQISSYTKVLKEATSSHDFQLQRLAEQTLMNFASWYLAFLSFVQSFALRLFCFSSGFYIVMYITSYISYIKCKLVKSCVL